MEVKTTVAIRVIGAFLVALAWTIPAFAHEPTPAQDFRCGQQFVTFFIEGEIEETDDDDKLAF